MAEGLNFPDAFIVATNILDLDYQHGGVPHRLSREEALAPEVEQWLIAREKGRTERYLPKAAWLNDQGRAQGD